MTIERFGDFTILKADEGMAIKPKDQTEHVSMLTEVSIGKETTPESWEDCEYGETEDATEADKDAALSTLGVDMTEG